MLSIPSVSQIALCTMFSTIMMLGITGCKGCSGVDTTNLSLNDAHFENLTLRHVESQDLEIAKAYSSLNRPSSTAGDFKAIDGDTNVVLLSRELAKNGVDNISLLPDEQSSRYLLQAFAGYSYQGFTESEGLDIGAVFFIKAREILKTAKIHTSDVDEINRYFMQQFKHINDKAKSYRNGVNVFAIIPAHLPASVKIDDIKSVFSDSFLLILSNEVSPTLSQNKGMRFSKFVPRPLTGLEIRNLAYFKLAALHKKETSNIDLEFVSKELAKVLRGVIYRVDLADIDNLSETIFSVLKNRSSPKLVEHSNTIHTEVARRFNIAFSMLNKQKLVDLTVEEVEEQVALDPGAFIRDELDRRDNINTQDLRERLRRNVREYQSALVHEIERLDTKEGFRITKAAADTLILDSNRYIEYITRVAADDACSEAAKKRFRNWGVRVGGSAEPRSYFRDHISALPVGSDSERDFFAPNRYSATLFDMINRRQSINLTFESERLKTMVVNCYLHGNSAGQLDSKVLAVTNALASIKDMVHSSADAMDQPMALPQVLGYFNELRDYETVIAKQLNARYSDFSRWDVIPADYFVERAWAVKLPFGKKAMRNLLNYQKSNRRLYGFLFAHILGESLDHPSVPFSGNRQLYYRAQLGSGLIGEFKDRAESTNLANRFLRTYLIKELQLLLGIYGDIGSKYYSLSSKSINQLETSEASDFKNFFDKIKGILRGRVIANDLSDLSHNFDVVLYTVEHNFMPREITTMLNSHPSSHPWAVLQGMANLKPVFDPSVHHVNRANVENYLNSIANGDNNYLINSGDRAALIDEIISLVRFKHELSDNTVRSVARPAALKPIRFVAGSDATILDRSCNAFDKNLAPIFSDLQQQVRALEVAISRVYFCLNLLMKF